MITNATSSTLLAVPTGKRARVAEAVKKWMHDFYAALHDAFLEVAALAKGKGGGASCFDHDDDGVCRDGDVPL